ncbi:hypothetical protein [Oscillatoria sp. FACHB-1406]|uniref:hypothetical protein n=1 Tax=Oscillatoria sp. FACHB-1406 TaxID=2692846 RepID=UPI0016872FAF|nr:hypothetical protein [Oscillatoria sp. FACHB-1406]MBD2580095.1 hypothetical protein [Oscillatoria sp. FACHB-1406]
MLTSQKLQFITVLPEIEALKTERLARPQRGAIRSLEPAKLDNRRIQCRRGSGRREILAA